MSETTPDVRPTGQPARSTAARPRPGRPVRPVAALSLLALLAACGGGGGGGDAGDPLLPSAAAISAANADGVARQSLVAASYLADTGGLVTAAQVAPGARELLGFARAQVRRLPGLLAGRTALATGATTTDTLPCTGGGTLQITATVASPTGAVAAGDSGRLTARNCVEDGVTLNGSIGIGFTAVSGDVDSDRYSAAASVTLESLRAVTAAGSASGSGSFVLTIDSVDAFTRSMSLAVASLSVSGTFGGTNDTLVMQDFRLASSSALVNGRGRTTTTVSGSVGSAVLAGGTVVLATVQPLVQFDGDSQPVSGQLTATGAAQSRLRMTVQNGANVLLELDANGDGAIESSTVRSWASLV